MNALMRQFFTYILRCRDGSYYTGHTDDLEMRLASHQNGTFPCYTWDRLPIALVWSATFATRDEALASERKIKGWSRAKKEALILNDWTEIRRLARSRKVY